MIVWRGEEPLWSEADGREAASERLAIGQGGRISDNLRWLLVKRAVLAASYQADVDPREYDHIAPLLDRILTRARTVPVDPKFYSVCWKMLQGLKGADREISPK